MRRLPGSEGRSEGLAVYLSRELEMNSYEILTIGTASTTIAPGEHVTL
jgi:hypothetical protein